MMPDNPTKKSILYTHIRICSNLLLYMKIMRMFNAQISIPKIMMEYCLLRLVVTPASFMEKPVRLKENNSPVSYTNSATGAKNKGTKKHRDTNKKTD